RIDTALVCLATNRNNNFSKMIFDGMVKNVNNKVSKFLMYPSQGEACPINSGFIADQDRATIAKSSTLPYDSAPRVTSPAADEATVLAREINVPTGSGFIPTAGPPTTVISTSSEVGPTASPIVTRRKGKEVMVESDTLKKKKLQEQIDAQVARELEEQ
nr:hypothetical protein [Tanacetum cinerariifolium]